MWRLDAVAALVILGLSVLLVLTKSSVDGAVAGLALVYAIQLTALLQRVVFITIETETHMTSAERIFHYSSVEQEPPAHIPEVDLALGTSWPSKSAVEFRNVSMRYRENDLVLRNVNLNIRGGDRVGVCGRTGAGKSSLFVALFRMNGLDGGSILIDGVDITTMGLQKLRRSIGIIPQDPTLLSGTLRFNIDPWREQSDASIWGVLDRVRLSQTVRSLGGGEGLDVAVEEDGGNLSQGERQLVCIARALLRSDVRLLVLDEATASIDAETDGLVQRAIRDVAGSITTITIAHRLQTIADADAICVMHEGMVAEYGPPSELLQRPDGRYAAMAKAAGLSTAATTQLGVLGDAFDETPTSPLRMSVPFFAPPPSPSSHSSTTTGSQPKVSAV
jgi:ABC-type multidrug transport system fused ATPase/permease subunit